MDTVQQRQIEILSKLVKYCNDGYNGYADLTENTNEKELKTIFNSLSKQRKKFAEELNEEILSLGGERITGGSTEGNFHQTWLNLKAMAVSDDVESLIKTAKTGEEHVYEAYQKHVTDSDIPSFLRQKLLEQHSQIKKAYHQLNEMENELELN